MLEIRLSPTDDILRVYYDFGNIIEDFNANKIDKHYMASYMYGQAKNGLFYHIIYLKEWNIKNLTHEISHCIDYLFERTGLYGSELRAYYQGWLYEIIKESHIL